MSLVIQMLIRGLLVPVLIAGAGLILARLLPGKARELGRAAALAAAFLVGYVLLIGLPQWPLSGAPDSSIAAALISAPWLMAELYTGQRRWAKRYFLLLLVAGLTVHPMIKSLWPASYSLTVVTTAAVLGLVAWIVVHEGTRQMTPGGSLGILSVLAMGLSLFMGMNGSALMSQLTGAVCAILAVSGIISLWKWPALEEEFIPFSVLMLFSLSAGFYFFVDVSGYTHYWLLSPLVLFMIRYIVRWEARPLTDMLAMAALSAAPVGFILWSLKS